MIDVPAPLDCLDGSSEIITSKDQVRDLFGCRATRTHSYANISYIDAFDIVDAVTCKNDILFQLFETINYHLLMDWPCSCKNSELLHYIPECLYVANMTVAIKSSAHIFELVSMHNCISSTTVAAPNDSSLSSHCGGCL